MVNLTVPSLVSFLTPLSVSSAAHSGPGVKIGMLSSGLDDTGARAD